MKKFPLVSLTILNFFILHAAFAQYPGPSNFNASLPSGLTYTHPQGIFTLQFPQGWIQTNTTDLRQAAYFILIQNGTALAEAAIYVETLSQTVTPQMYAIGVEENTLRRTPGYQKAAENVVAINGQMAAYREFSYSANLQGQTKMVLSAHYYFVVGNLAYLLHFATYPEIAPQVKNQFLQIAQSFKISGGSAMNTPLYQQNTSMNLYPNTTGPVQNNAPVYNPYASQTNPNPYVSATPINSGNPQDVNSPEFIQRWMQEHPYEPPPVDNRMTQQLDAMAKQWQAQHPAPTVPTQNALNTNPYNPPLPPTQQTGNATTFTMNQQTPLSQTPMPQTQKEEPLPAPQPLPEIAPVAQTVHTTPEATPTDLEGENQQ
ncbi:MAG: hypothetical protein HYS08_02590 [Chlamydiae bacterium]|nr:hypothetical protein [Chlamydiota bacterium]MBI3266618.1 hypothetical protein [Chlamydiota bacterium]